MLNPCLSAKRRGKKYGVMTLAETFLQIWARGVQAVEKRTAAAIYGKKSET